MKKIILGVIIGLLIASVVYAADVLTSADNISYADGKTVSDALNDLLGKADATAEDILVGKKAYVNGELITGTMPNNEAVSEVIGGGETYTIPAGYHDGSGIITSNFENSIKTINYSHVRNASGDCTVTITIDGVEMFKTTQGITESKTYTSGDYIFKYLKGGGYSAFGVVYYKNRPIYVTSRFYNTYGTPDSFEETDTVLVVG